MNSPDFNEFTMSGHADSKNKITVSDNSSVRLPLQFICFEFLNTYEPTSSTEHARQVPKDTAHL